MTVLWDILDVNETVVMVYITKKNYVQIKR